MEKLKGDSMNSSGHNNGLQRPYLSTDEYPPPNGIPGVYPPMPFSSLGNSRHLDGLEGLALDRRYNFNDVALHVSGCVEFLTQHCINASDNNLW